MVARKTVAPSPPDTMDEQELFMQRLEVLQRQNPEIYGPVGSQISPKVADAVWGAVMAEWHTVPPLNTRTYVFKGLGDARRYGNETITLRFKPQASKTLDGMVRMLLRVNGRVYQPRGRPPAWAEDTFHVEPIPVSLIDEQGRIVLDVRNRDPRDPRLTLPVSITFEPGDGLQLYYTAGTFEGNLVRSLFISLLSMGLLAMLGLAAGTFTPFRVAALATGTGAIISCFSDYINESLRFFASLGPRDATFGERASATVTALGEKFGGGEIIEGFKIILRLLGEAVMLFVPSFGRYPSVQSMVDGRLIPLSTVGSATLWIGVVWTGLCLLVAWLIWRKRELAKITV